MILAWIGISSPFNPSGYPVPSYRSWWLRATSVTWSINLIFFRISAPITVCSLITAYSSSVSFVGLFKIVSGIPILPISCRCAAFRKFEISFWLQPSSFAIRTAYSATRWECPLVYSSFASIVVDKVCIICRDMVSICFLRFLISCRCRRLSIFCKFRIVLTKLKNSSTIIPIPIKIPEIEITKYADMDSTTTETTAISKPTTINLFCVI